MIPTATTGKPFCSSYINKIFFVITTAAKSISAVNIAAIVFLFFLSVVIVDKLAKCFPEATNSKNVLSVTIVVNDLLSAAIAVKYYFVAVTATKLFS